jgi:hypothetical protein
MCGHYSQPARPLFPGANKNILITKNAIFPKKHEKILGKAWVQKCFANG